MPTKVREAIQRIERDVWVQVNPEAGIGSLNIRRSRDGSRFPARPEMTSRPERGTAF